jgi:hypothetical protein
MRDSRESFPNHVMLNSHLGLSVSRRAFRPSGWNVESSSGRDAL